MSQQPPHRPFADLAKRLAREKAAAEKAAAERAAVERASAEAKAAQRAAAERAAADTAAANKIAFDKAAVDKAAAEKAAAEKTESVAPDSFAALAARSQVVPLPRPRLRVERLGEVPPTLPVVPIEPPTERYEIEQDDRSIEGRRIDVDVEILDELRRAYPRTRLDLHGMAAEEARRRLHRFIIGRHAQGDRVVLVIVGKGTHSPSRRGVLRDEVAHWLSEPRMAHFVRAFVSARREHGGTGALYVRIRR